MSLRQFTLHFSPKLYFCTTIKQKLKTMIDYIVNNLWTFWAIVMTICVIFELTTGGFFMLCFAFGALAAIPFTFVGLDLLWQIGIFTLASAAAIFLVRPIAVRYLHTTGEMPPASNADAIIGREGTVSEDIPENGYGRVALDGDDWKALSTDGSAIEKGTRVVITARDSLIVTVSAKK